ncbi:MAG: hypothetical protein AAF480_11995 [Actinomycetota bacterium]
MGVGEESAGLETLDVALARMAPEERLDVNVEFDPVTLVATADVAYRIHANTAYVANLISPQRWVDMPFFVASSWLTGEPVPESGARTGLFYEHLDFRVQNALLRSVENRLWIEYTGWDPNEGRTKIGCVFNLHSSVDDLLTIDRGYYRAVPEDGDRWSIEMRKQLRFSDPVNSSLAPTLLTYWLAATHPDAIQARRGVREDP